MDILLVSSEVAPFSQTSSVVGGGAAQNVASLAKALRGLHHKVTVISPLYSSIDPTGRSLARRLSKVDVSIGADRFQCELYDGRTTGGVDLIFLGERELFGARSDVLSVDSPKDVLASAVFCRAVAQIASARDPQPDVVYAVGAAGALSLGFCKALLPNARLVLGVHDIAAIGSLGAQTALTLGLEPRIVSDLGLASASSLLAIGAAVADRVVLPSATLADQWMLDPQVLDGKLASPANKTLAIIDGVDAGIWNPLTDAALSGRFDPMDLTGKRHCKAQLQRQLQLPERADVPLIIVVGPVVAASSAQALSSVVADLLNNDLQIVVVTQGQPADVAALAKLHERFPDRVALQADADNSALHQALGAADLLVLPESSEPIEPLHRCAQRYGALPIVARVGRVIDTVVDCDPELGTGNGFLFDDERALLPTIQRAVAAYARTQAFEKLRVRVMRVDSSWERAARLYDQAFQSRKLTN